MLRILLNLSLCSMLNEINPLTLAGISPAWADLAHEVHAEIPQGIYFALGVKKRCFFTPKGDRKKWAERANIHERQKGAFKRNFYRAP